LQNCDTPSSSSAPGRGGVEYVMKTDDDMYINLPKLYELVQANKKPNLLLGSLICNAVPIKARNKYIDRFFNRIVLLIISVVDPE
jgi:hypothetical protein